MNSDFILSKIKVIEANNGPLIKEWNELTWNVKKRLLGEFEELASKDNHLADAALYLHHFSKHYRATPEPAKTGSDMEQQAIKLYEEANSEASIQETYEKGYE